MRFPYYLFVLYFVSRFFNLVSLPIFNDEAIYLHWGQIMVNLPHQAFFSLFDGKPPLILWFWGWLEKLSFDPLVAGRLGTILIGFLTLYGLLQISKFLNFTKTAQVMVGLLYIFNPLVLFFDRLTLFDSPVSAVFVWVLYFSLVISQNQKFNYQHPLFLGLVQGLGYWTKGTCRFFLFLPFIVPLLTLVLERDKKKALREFASFLISYVVAEIIFLPVRLQPLFASFSKKESDFLLSPNQAFNFQLWLNHLDSFLLTMLVFISPVVLGLSFYGFWQLFKHHQKESLIMSLFALLPLAAEVLIARQFFSRYYLFTIIPFLLLAAYSFQEVKTHLRLKFAAILGIPVILTTSLLFNPLSTLSLIGQNQTLKNDFGQYYTGWTSGYGVMEAINWLQSESAKGPAIVTFRADSGNPEDALQTYLGNNQNLLLVRLNRQPTPQELGQVAKYPIYFVSRGQQYLGMQDRLTEIKKFPKPSGEEFVGLYRLQP